MALGASLTRRPARPRRDRGGPTGGPLVLLAALVAVGTLAWGLSVEAGGVQLGTPNPPFNYRWLPRTELGWALAAGLLLAATVAGAPALLTRPRRPLAVAAALAVLALLVRLAVAAARHGTEGWYRVFDGELSFEAANEYLPALPAARLGLGFLLDRFAELVPALPVHAAGHPPGVLLVLAALGIDSPEGMAALCIGAGALAAPLTYALGRALLADERAARVAGLLAVLSPSLVIHGAVSADALFATLGALAAALLVARRPALRALGALAVAVASLFSWALLAVAAFAALAVWAREGLRAAVVLSAACGAALLGFHGLLALLVGWDPIGALRETEAVYRIGIAAVRPYWFWVLGSPVAAFVALGLPIAGYALRALWMRRPAALALAAVVLVASVAGFTKAEVERIWLPFVPLACVAAASVLPPRRLVWVAGLLALQALATELVFDTLW
jgi:hypothetical protein